MNPLSKVNHFPGSQYLGWKDLMHEVINASKYKTKLTPWTWVLPKEYEDFLKF